MAFNVNKFISHFDSHGGFARTSKFEARITLPEVLTQATSMESLALQCETAELPGYAINTVEQKIFGAPTYMGATPAFNDISLTFICAGDMWEKKLFDAWMNYIIPKQTYLVNYKNTYATKIFIDQYSDYVGTPAAAPGSTTPNLKQLVESGIKSGVRDTLNSLAIRKLGGSLVGDVARTVINNKFDQVVGNGGTPPASQTGTKIYSVELVNAFPTTVNAMQLNWASDDIHRVTVTFKYDKWLDASNPNPINLPPVTQDGTIKTQNLTGQVKGVILSSLLGKLQGKL